MPGLSALTARAYSRLFARGRSGTEGWGRYITGSGPGKSFAFQMGLGYMRDFVYGDPKWDFHSFNPERDAQIAHQKLAAISLPSDPT